MVSQRLIVGFYLVDEAVWSGVSPTELGMVAGYVKSDYPQQILFYVESAVVFVRNINSFDQPINYTQISSSFDWFGVDAYPNIATIPIVKQAYEDYVYPRMDLSRQKVFLIPPAYDSTLNRTASCGATNCVPGEYES